MINLTTVFSTSLDSVKRRFIKVLRMGRNDVQTPVEAMPFGFDGNPLKNMVSVYASTGEKGKPVLLGYINKHPAMESGNVNPGETRIYSLDENGNLKTYVLCRVNGTIELGGITHNAVRYTPLNSGLQSQVNLINTQLAAIATAIGTLGGAYVAVPITLDISASKINEIKTV